MKEVTITQESIYPSRYYVKSIEKQLECLRQYKFDHPSYGIDEKLIEKIRKREIVLPSGAEGWFAIPNPLIDCSVYLTLQLDLMRALEACGYNKLYIYRVHQLKGNLKLHANSIKKLSQLDVEQGHPGILIIPAQFGFLHPNQTAQEARQKFMDNEFGLGALSVGAMLLTHPERIGDPYENPLRLNCPGDVLQGTHVPYWNYGYHGELSLDFFSAESQQGNNVSGFIY